MSKADGRQFARKPGRKAKIGGSSGGYMGGVGGLLNKDRGHEIVLVKALRWSAH